VQKSGLKVEGVSEANGENLQPLEVEGGLKFKALNDNLQPSTTLNHKLVESFHGGPEANCEAEAKTLNLSTAKTNTFTPPSLSDTFVVGEDWTEIPNGVLVPAGCEIRMDFATGKNYARRRGESEDRIDTFDRFDTSPHTEDSKNTLVDSSPQLQQAQEGAVPNAGRITPWGIPIPDGWDPNDPVFQRDPMECGCFRDGVLRCAVPCVWAWPPGAKPGDKAIRLIENDGGDSIMNMG
jgi:hypothetical protein